MTWAQEFQAEEIEHESFPRAWEIEHENLPPWQEIAAEVRGKGVTRCRPQSNQQS